MPTFAAALFVLLAACGTALAQTPPSPDIVKALAPSGKLRAAMNFGNPVLVQKGPNGEPLGVSPELATALAKRLGVPIDFVIFPAAGKAFDGVAHGDVDIGFIAIEPARSAEIEFSPPYVIIYGAYLVRKDSPLKEVTAVDAPGIKIGVGLGSVYDLYLTRTLKNATLVRNPKGGAAGGIEPFIAQHLDAAAGVREPMDGYAKDHPDTRVIPGSFEEIRQAIAIPKGRPPAAIAYLHSFVEEMKANGFVADALKRSGQTAPVAAPEK
ncbi:MAG TPA: ABC transporter substrate-binding protein [Xanthobacteraceae bacterium]|jgi:polar amino acid transport system substrate-binding protein|nr:ABC transporter substrate-binding protein [Xanthobacteraceae bacterium]